MMRYLINKGVDPNILDDQGWSPLLNAVKECMRESTAILLTSGARIDHQNNLSRTALSYTAQ
jgi:ankyrin repeat protein